MDSHRGAGGDISIAHLEHILNSHGGSNFMYYTYDEVSEVVTDLGSIWVTGFTPSGYTH